MKIKLKNILFGSIVLCMSIGIVQANLPKNITDNFPSANIKTDSIVIEAPFIAENGAVVNIEIKQVALPNSNLHVKEIWVFDHYRKTPLAHFKLGPQTLPEGLKARYKLRDDSVIYAIALLSDGTMMSGNKLIKVTIGGCGGGGGGSESTTGSDYVPPTYIPATTHNQSYNNNELAFFRMRYKNPQEETSQELKHAILKKHIKDSIIHTSNNFRFATAVAAFGQLLADSKYVHNLDYAGVHQLAVKSLGLDERGYRSEFLSLVKLADTL